MTDPRKTCLLDVRHHAISMHEAATVHHWTKNQGTPSAYHIDRAHDEFAAIAEILGYEIKLKEAT
jgi:hypothetical protein